jgi:tetratricopeptide (TPR) repeat protein
VAEALPPESLVERAATPAQTRGPNLRSRQSHRLFGGISARGMLLGAGLIALAIMGYSLLRPAAPLHPRVGPMLPTAGADSAVRTAHAAVPQISLADKNAVETHMQSAYTAILGHDYARAFDEYRAALAIDPKQVALLTNSTPASLTPPAAAPPGSAASSGVETLPAASVVASGDHGHRSVRGGSDTPVEESPALPRAAPSREKMQISTFDSSKALDRHLEAGYHALLTRDYGRAYVEYRAALSLDPHRADALRGLAALAAHDGKRAEASRLYGSVLQLVPNDPDALAGLASVSDDSGEDQESHLKYAVAADGERVAAHVALGNLYAQQGRWPEAGQEYFTALSKDPGNPDLAFNLAASLDQARGPRMAATYYRQALEFAQQRPATFDSASVSKRLDEITQGSVAR